MEYISKSGKQLSNLESNFFYGKQKRDFLLFETVYNMLTIIRNLPLQ